jgi:hypothetical protein
MLSSLHPSTVVKLPTKKIEDLENDKKKIENSSTSKYQNKNFQNS